ncbi:MAG: phosphate propanoyltransferase [Anaerobacillus sp.]|uniref:phosphate propanoyltransferase n=1 Tax=Anaerobacillus sp. TaxID=1872506 RepID=UPI003919FB7B
MKMNDVEVIVKKVLEKIATELSIPVGISNRHIHLTEADFNELFPNQPIKIQKMLKQPGEFAAEQTVTVVGPKGKIERVRILGPFRYQSQVELSKTDARQIGLSVPIRMSGDLKGSPGIQLVSDYGKVTLSKGAIIAKRHIHMSPMEARLLQVNDGDDVAVRIKTATRSVVFEQCHVRVGNNFSLEMHIDTDEANAADIGGDAVAKVVKS